jgi:hypothetical protein
MPPSPEEAKAGPALCPSARCDNGAVLLAMPGDGGQAEFFGHPVAVPEALLTFAAAGGTPETSFRFASPCRHQGCRHWSGTRCGVIDAAQPLLAPHAAPANELPECGIREQCRWHLQTGPAACAVCPLVVTDMRPRETRPALAHC